MSLSRATRERGAEYGDRIERFLPALEIRCQFYERLGISNERVYLIPRCRIRSNRRIFFPYERQHIPFIAPHRFFYRFMRAREKDHRPLCGAGVFFAADIRKTPFGEKQSARIVYYFYQPFLIFIPAFR